jgi:hypothetical protein
LAIPGFHRGSARGEAEPDPDLAAPAVTSPIGPVAKLAPFTGRLRSNWTVIANGRPPGWRPSRTGLD